MKNIIRLIALALTLPLSSACGDALVDAQWRGEALFTINGFVYLALSPEEFEATDYLQDGELRTALFWAPTRGSSYSLAGAVEQDVSAVGSFPARFALTIYAPPPTELLRPDPETSADFAVGLLVAYRDINGNDQWDRATERFVGGATDRFVLYVPNGIANTAFGRLDAGFHRIKPGAPCDGATESARYELDEAANVSLMVGRGFPADVRLTLACDEASIQWSGACPPLPSVRDRCGATRTEVQGLPDPMCASCRPLLAPILNDEVGCQRWLETCVLRFPGGECQREYNVCLGAPDGPAAPPPGTCDAACTCQRVFEQCLDNNPRMEGPCRERLDLCLRETRR